ncbi:MAG: GNAT family N-acetyltransferase [Anaerolineae bacterium]|nr:GNAT family N-acetyltransferase [Anaerolineae bacterium]
MALSIDTYRSVSGFKELEDEWNGLLHRSSADTVFLTLEFQRVWWRYLGEGELLIVTVRDDGELTGIAPLFATANSEGKRVLAIVGCVEVADYLDLIAAKGREEEVCAALANYLASPHVPAWDVLDLCNVHQDSPTLAVLPSLAESHGWTASIAKEDVCPVAQLPGSWDEYLQALNKKHRHELRRKLRRAEAEADLGWYIVGPSHDLGDEVESFLDLMAASAPDKEAFLTPQMRSFFRQLAHVMYDAGWLQLAFLEVAGQKAAAYLNFVYDNRVLVYNSGLDWQSFPHLSTGIILAAYCIQYAIAHGCEAVDFMQGDERYKYQLGGQDVEVRRLTIRK